MSSGAPQEQGTPIRYPSVALLCVDTEDTVKFNAAGYRIDDNRPSSIYINNQSPLLFGYMTRIALTEMDVVWDIPNVNSRNNTITIKSFAYTDATPPVVTSNTTVYSLPLGFYTHQELATELQTLLNGNSFNVINGLTFTVTVGSKGTFTINQTAQYAPSLRFKGAFQFLKGSTDYDLLDPMGITPINSNFTQFTSGLAPMCYTPYVDVVSNFLTKNQNVTDGTSQKIYTSSKLARIYFSNEEIKDVTPVATSNSDTNFIGTSPFMFRREFKFPKQIMWNTTENVDIIDIQVLDYKGNPVIIEPVTVEDTNQNTELNETIAYQEGTVFRFTVQATET